MADRAFTNRAKCTTSTTGTGTLTLGSAVAQHHITLVDGKRYGYIILDPNGTGWEIGEGTYTASGTTLTRGALQSTNGDNAISISGAGATVIIGLSALDAASSYRAARGFIQGLEGTWVDATHVGCGVGAAHIESIDQIIEVNSAPSNLAPSIGGAAAVYYVYLKTDGSLEVSTTAPVLYATAAGSARSKSGDTSRRFLYAFYSDGSSNALKFDHLDLGGGVSEMIYTAQSTAAPYKIISAHTSGSMTSKNLSTIVPPNIATHMAQFVTLNSSGGGGAGAQASVDGTNVIAHWAASLASSTYMAAPSVIPISRATPLIYVAAQLNSLDMYCTGYRFRR